jgi:DnaK suppressor protein
MSVLVLEEYCPTETEEYMNQLQLDFFKKKLTEWRNELDVAAQSFVQTLKESTLRKPDPVEQSATITDMALDFQTRCRQQQLIKEIDYALEKMKEGEYGYCEISGEEIGLKRLLARPIATMCIEVQERHERMSIRTVRYVVPGTMM